MPDHQQSSFIENCWLWTDVNLLQVNLTCNFFLALNNTWDKKKSYLSTHFVGEIEYDVKTEEWIEITLGLINEKNSLPTFSLLLALKKLIFQEITAIKSHTIYNNTNRH